MEWKVAADRSSETEPEKVSGTNENIFRLDGKLFQWLADMEPAGYQLWDINRLSIIFESVAASGKRQQKMTKTENHIDSVALKPCYGYDLRGIEMIFQNRWLSQHESFFNLHPVMSFDRARIRNQYEEKIMKDHSSIIESSSSQKADRPYPHFVDSQVMTESRVIVQILTLRILPVMVIRSG
jgi:hypothetical protein